MGRIRVIGNRLGTGVVGIALAIVLLAATSTGAFAHSRLDRADPPVGAELDGSPFVLTAWFTQELTSRSTIRVLDANGVQVDLGDGHVNMDDPDRKMMHVSLPALPPGIYTVETVAQSAEDGHDELGTFAFGVGMAPPATDAPATDQPAETPSAAPIDEAAPADGAAPTENVAPSGQAAPSESGGQYGPIIYWLTGY